MNTQNASVMHYHVTPSKNLGSIMQVGLVPAIGARSKAFGETVPRVYLFTGLDACENALINWLGEEFEHLADEGLVILEIASNGLSGDSGVAFEFACSSVVSPDRILRVLDECLNPLPWAVPTAERSVECHWPEQVAVLAFESFQRRASHDGAEKAGQWLDWYRGDHVARSMHVNEQSRYDMCLSKLKQGQA